MLARLLSPSTGLLLLVVLHTANIVLSGHFGEYSSVEADFAFMIGFTLLLTWWVHVDRCERRYPAPFEFEAFVFFAWMLVVPCYLIHTRRWKAIPLIAALYGAYWYPYLVGMMLYGA